MLLPTTKRIITGDIKNDPNSLERLLPQINTYFDAIYNALAKNLNFQDNFQSQENVITFRTVSDYDAGVFPLIKFVKTIGKKASGLVLFQITQEADFYTPIMNGVYVDWTEEAGNIIIGYVTGLVALKKYSMRVMVF